RIVLPDGTVVSSGDAECEGERLILPLTASGERFGTLELVGNSFSKEQRMNAASLAAHAVVALENARLHGMVERQALVDGLTGLANRRAAMPDRKSTRLNSSHVSISYAVFCLKK